MSRVGKAPVEIPQGVDVKLNERVLTVKGKLGELHLNVFPNIEVVFEDNAIRVIPKNQEKKVRAMHGTTRALIANMVKGVSVGFEKKLNLVGVGYRAKLDGKCIKLELGFSHDVFVDVPEVIQAQIPSQTEIVLKSHDKRELGEFAAKLRNNYRPPEPYKGKGIRYSDEVVILKETRKK